MREKPRWLFCAVRCSLLLRRLLVLTFADKDPAAIKGPTRLIPAVEQFEKLPHYDGHRLGPRHAVTFWSLGSGQGIYLKKCRFG